MKISPLSLTLTIIQNNERQFLQFMEELLSMSAPSKNIILNTPDINGLTPLMYALAHGRISMTKLLLQQGASADQSKTFVDSCNILKYDLLKESEMRVAH